MIWTFVSRTMSLLFNTLSKFVIAFLSRSNHLLISWLQSQSSVTLDPKRKSITTSTLSPSICHVIMGPVAMILVFSRISFKPALSLSSFTFIKRLMLKLKLQYFGHQMWTDDIGKVPDAGKDWGQNEKRASEDEMAAQHQWCNEHELGKTLGDDGGQGGLSCCNPWGRKVSDTTGRLKNNNNETLKTA